MLWTHTHTYNRFKALWILSGTTWVSRYQKKHSPIHTYRDHQSSVICFIHVVDIILIWINSVGGMK